MLTSNKSKTFSHYGNVGVEVKNKGNKRLALQKVNYNPVLGDATLVYFQILRNFKITCFVACISEHQLNLTENKLNLTGK